MARVAFVSVVAALAVAAASFPTSGAGAAGQEQPPFRSGVDLLEVDVTVTEDRGRQPVTDLDAAGFRVRIGGDVRRVVQARLLSPPPPGRTTTRRPARRAGPAPFARPDALQTSNAGAGLAPAGDRGRLVVLAVDPESIPFGEGRHLLHTAAEFVERLHPADRVSLVEIPGPEVRVPPTRDHGRVRQAVARLGGMGDRPGSHVLCIPTRGRLTLFEAFEIHVYRQDHILHMALNRIHFYPNGREACPIRDPQARRMQEVRARAEAARMVGEAEVLTGQRIRGMESLLRSLRGGEEPKLVVWISGGLAIDRNTSLVRGLVEEAAASRATIVAVKVQESDVDLEGRFSNPRPMRLRNRDRLILEQGLDVAADLSGGEFYRAVGNGQGIFERIEAQLAGHYRLAVEVGPRERIDRGRIDVAVAWRGARARVRHAAARAEPGGAGDASAGGAGRQAGGRAAAGLSVDDHLRAMLRAPEPAPGLPLRVSTYAFPDGGGQARVAVRTEVGGGGVDGSQVTLAYALLDSWGAVVSSARRDLSGASAGPQDDGRTAYEFPIAAGAGRYRLRVAALDGAGRGGSVEHPLRVGLALSDAPVVLGALEVRDAAAGPDGGAAEVDPGGSSAEREAEDELPRPGAAPGDPVVSSGALAVALDVRAESAWVFNRLRVTVDVARDEVGPALVETEAQLGGRDDEPRRRAAVRLPVAGLPAGSYVARVRVLRGTEPAATTWRAFRIVE